MIRPIFTNTASLTTSARWIMRGGTGTVTLPVRVGLIIHPDHGPVLIDAGYGPQVTAAPGRSWALRAYTWMLGPSLHPTQSPLALLAAHGFTAQDVRLALVTHLHADHVAYLPDLPQARFVTDAQIRGRVRHGVFNALLPADFAARQTNLRDYASATLPYDLGEGFDIFGDGTVLGVPLPGHAPGHYGLCFTGGTPLLYAVDAQWLLPALLEDRMPGFPASLIAAQPAAMAQTAALVRAFVNAGGEVMLCHDPTPTPYDWVPDA